MTTKIFDPEQEQWRAKCFTLLRLFYFLVFLDFLHSATFLNVMLSQSLSEGVYPKTLLFFNWLPTHWTILGLIVFGFTFSLGSFLVPTALFMRAGQALIFLLSKGFIFSHTRFSHHYWPMLLALVLLSFCPSLKSKKNWLECLKSPRHIQVALAMYYVLPGLWKIVSAAVNGHLFRADWGPNMFAFYLITHGKRNIFAEMATAQGLLCTIGLWGAIVFQVMTVLIIWKKNWQRAWSIMVLGFHALGLLVLSVNFFLAGIVFFLFFYFDPKNTKVSIKFDAK